MLHLESMFLEPNFLSSHFEHSPMDRYSFLSVSLANPSSQSYPPKARVQQHSVRLKHLACSPISRPRFVQVPVAVQDVQHHLAAQSMREVYHAYVVAIGAIVERSLYRRNGLKKST